MRQFFSISSRITETVEEKDEMRKKIQTNRQPQLLAHPGTEVSLHHLLTL